jgi:outer membrane protein TolC
MVDQPVLGLLRLEQERRAQDALARAGDAQARSTAAGLREAIALGFLRHFEARALERVAQASLDELQQQQEVARARLASGVATEADVLRIQTAVANARQQAIGARSQAEVARVGVLADVGLGADERDVELIEPSALLARSASQPAAAEAPLRPELELRLQQASAAEHQARGRGFALLPDVDLEAAYLRVDGQKFAPANSLYVGLRAQWAVWEWGASLQQHRAAVHQARAARADAQAERLQIDREVATAQAQEVAASAAVDAARAAIASAEEAYRVTDAQVRAGTATTTDLIEAQAALTQARSNLTRAEYGVAVARVALAYARGE